jgi:hypothetical protein
MEELQVYPEANLQRQSPFAAMMHARQLEMGTIRQVEKLPSSRQAQVRSQGPQASQHAMHVCP